MISVTFLKVKFWKKNDKFIFYFRPNHINLLLEMDKSDQKRMELWNEDIKHQKNARCWRVSQDLLVKKVIKKTTLEFPLQNLKRFWLKNLI